MIPAVVLPAELFTRRSASTSGVWSPLRLLSFPILWTSYWSLLSLTRFGTYFVPSAVLVEIVPLAQCVSLIGAVGLQFVPAFVASSLAGTNLFLLAVSSTTLVTSLSLSALFSILFLSSDQ